jgi:hypothetical protein
MAAHKNRLTRTAPIALLLSQAAASLHSATTGTYLIDGIETLPTIAANHATAGSIYVL